jgi:hypothetical protein
MSESHGDSNRCTPCRRKPDQHATRIPRSVRVWSQIIRISRGQLISTFHKVVNRVKHGHYSREKGSQQNQQHAGWPIHGSIVSFSPEPTNEAVGAKPTFCWRPATRLIEAISLTCYRYIQYLLAKTNPSVLNWHRRGYNLGGVGLSHTTPQPSQPTVFTFHLRAPPSLQFNQNLSDKPKLSLRNLWPPCGIPTTQPSVTP